MINSVKLDIDATKALVFCAVLLSVTVLISQGKLDSEYLKYLLAWLIPGPLSFDKGAEAQADRQVVRDAQLAAKAVESRAKVLEVASDAADKLEEKNK